ncbi:MAG: glutaredoxin domain-containing protein [Synergistaceae bacterium]|nr:glutaredoxin domain-containing protein [Synergistaceae bacterium]
MNVKVYSTDTCPWCVKAKEYLESLNIEYDSVNVAGDKAAAMELVKKTRQMGVPVIQIGEKYIVGFDQIKINEMLKEAGLLK